MPKCPMNVSVQEIFGQCHPYDMHELLYRWSDQAVALDDFWRSLLAEIFYSHHPCSTVHVFWKENHSSGLNNFTLARWIEMCFYFFFFLIMQMFHRKITTITFLKNVQYKFHYNFFSSSAVGCPCVQSSPGHILFISLGETFRVNNC